MKLPDKIDVGGRPHTTECDKQTRRILLRCGTGSRARYIEIFCGCDAQYEAMVAMLAKEATK